VAGAFLLPPLRERVSIDALIAASQMLFAAVLTTLSMVTQFVAVCAMLFAAGAAWLMLLTSFTGSVQSMVPSWVRGRAISFHMLVVFGGMAVGSAIWGATAGSFGIHWSFSYAAGGLVVGLAATARLRLSSAGTLDLTPSMHWPNPSLPFAPQHHEGPVLVTVEYRIDPARAEEFSRAMSGLRQARMRGGAVRWELFRDTADAARYVESFLVESWVDHLRQHERVTVADREIEAAVLSFHQGEGPPRVTHLVARHPS
jgi:MFS family permease